jgi:predicted secreted Zn-dependent protease
MPIRLLLLACLSLVVTAMTVVAEDGLILTTNYYTVRGTTGREIRASINRGKPRPAGEERDAETRWNIRWRFTTTASSGSCRLHTFSTQTTIAITLPRWIVETNASPWVMTNWTRYIKALELHEAGHANFARAAAGEIRKKVQALPPQPNCDAVKNAVNATGRRVLEELVQREQAYDRTTRHGATQGAVFP